MALITAAEQTPESPEQISFAFLNDYVIIIWPDITYLTKFYFHKVHQELPSRYFYFWNASFKKIIKIKFKI